MGKAGMLMAAEALKAGKGLILHNDLQSDK